MTFKTKKPSIFWILVIISFFVIFTSINPINRFILLTILYLIFISSFFIKNYLAHKDAVTLLIAIAFILLLFGKFQFLFASDNPFFYVTAHILQLAGYIFIIINLYLISKNKTSGE